MTSDTSSKSPGGFARLLSPTLTVTIFTLMGQVVGLITQMVIAAKFGAQSVMDAFLAANTVPQYIIAILLNSLNLVFIPVFADQIAAGREEEAWTVASTIINTCLLLLTSLVFLGMLFAEPILRFTTPGLDEQSLRLASWIAIVTWPTILFTATAGLLTGIYQVRGKFGRPAAAPVLGAITNLAVIIILSRWLGVKALAIAALGSAVLQTLLLITVLHGHRRYRFQVAWGHPSVRQVLYLLIPLVLGAVIFRSTTIMERYVASMLPVGSISHLNYASRLMTLIYILISSGITAVIFPAMAADFASESMERLRQTMSLGLRMMWLLAAPATTIGIALASPLVMVIFGRGEFRPEDEVIVSSVFQVYMLALAGMSLANICGRGFYVLKDTKTPAVVGAVQTSIYIGYVWLLARYFGVTGVAWGYVLLFDISLFWQLIVIRYKMGNRGGRRVVVSFSLIALAAVLAGAASSAVKHLFTSVWMQLALGGISGFIVYGVILFKLGSAEAGMLRSATTRFFNAWGQENTSS